MFFRTPTGWFKHFFSIKSRNLYSNVGQLKKTDKFQWEFQVLNNKYIFNIKYYWLKSYIVLMMEIKYFLLNKNSDPSGWSGELIYYIQSKCLWQWLNITFLYSFNRAYVSAFIHYVHAFQNENRILFTDFFLQYKVTRSDFKFKGIFLIDKNQLKLKLNRS